MTSDFDPAPFDGADFLPEWEPRDVLGWKQQTSFVPRVAQSLKVLPPVRSEGELGDRLSQHFRGLKTLLRNAM
jgi:hypothetical protein